MYSELVLTQVDLILYQVNTGSILTAEQLKMPSLCIATKRRTRHVSIRRMQRYIYLSFHPTPFAGLPTGSRGVFLTNRLHGPVFQKTINANPRLKINQRVYFFTPKCCSTLIFGKTLH